MALFGRNKGNGSIADIIRCDEPSYLIWKWHPAGTQPGASKRENAIRWGSSLRVKEGEVAAFFYNQGDGILMDFIEGPYDDLLATANFPVLSDIIAKLYGGGTPFQAEVYFINLAQIIQVKFGVPFFDVFDPRFADFGVPVAVRGTITFKIEDYRAFIKLHQLRNFDLNDFQKQIRDAVVRYVKDAVSNAPAAHNIPVVQIESKTAQINDIVEYDIAQRLKDQFGVTVSSVDIGAIEIDKASEGYVRLMAITRDVTTARVKADEVDYEARLRADREEDQYARRKHTQFSNLGAYQVEAQTEVGTAGAGALGQANANGAGGCAGMNPGAVMAGMAVGSAVGQQIAGAMSGAPVTPPPIPVVAYHVAIDGKAAGPFDVAALKQMALAGQVTADSLVWKPGMAQWAKAGTIDELKSVLSMVPPPIPS